ncbi:MAG TPA: dTMP kinase [Candidatus Nanoarchaeia archaeon]|nr:dTMP kinase [Candidatus Nanoarchaeia archaeon]
MLITFEGIDGSGKSTQKRILKKYLESTGKKVILTEEPTNNPIGQEVKKLLKKDAYTWVEAILFAADRALHYEETIKNNKHRIIICDRYKHSTYAYQSAMGLDKKWLTCLNSQVPEPDLTIYLDVTPETAIKRIHHRGIKAIKYEELELLRKVRKNYLSYKSKTFKIINSEKSIKEVATEIQKIINAIIK